MAAFDFLNQGVGGTTPAQTAPGLMGEGDITTTPAQPIGPTWGQVGAGMLQYGSKPGSSGPMIAQAYNRGALPGQPALLPMPPQQAKATGQGSMDDDTFSRVVKYLATLAGLGGA